MRPAGSAGGVSSRIVACRNTRTHPTGSLPTSAPSPRPDPAKRAPVPLHRRALTPESRVDASTVAAADAAAGAQAPALVPGAGPHGGHCRTAYLPAAGGRGTSAQAQSGGFTAGAPRGSSFPRHFGASLDLQFHYYCCILGEVQMAAHHGVQCGPDYAGRRKQATCSACTMACSALLRTKMLMRSTPRTTPRGANRRRPDRPDFRHAGRRHPGPE